MPPAVPWGFYGRAEAFASLRDKLLRDDWCFAAMRGRRRVGKTELTRRVLDAIRERQPNRPILYVQMVEESWNDTATTFRKSIASEPSLRSVGLDTNSIVDLRDAAMAIGSICSAGGIVVLDEFQVCHHTPLRPFAGYLQFEVDNLQRENRRGALVVLGSVQSEMAELLHGRRSPLYGRVTWSRPLPPWTVGTTLQVARRHVPDYMRRFLTLWTVFDGVPKYWQHLAGIVDLLPDRDHHTWTMGLAVETFLDSAGPLRDEGELLLGRELERDNLLLLRHIAGRRFSTLRGIRQVFPGMDDVLDRLDLLVRDLKLVDERLPILRPDSNVARYVVSDPFLRSWVRVFERAVRIAEVEDPRAVAEAFLPDLRTLEGHAFEEFVRAASQQASRMGTADFPLTDLVSGYWNRPEAGGDIEIDYVGWHKRDRRVRFGSAKRNARAHDPVSLARFRSHVARYLETDDARRLREADAEYALFAPAFTPEQRSALEAEGYVCRDIADFAKMLGVESDDSSAESASFPEA